MKNLLDKVDLLKEKVNLFSDQAKEKATEYVNQLIEIMPILEEIGFKSSGITLAMSIPPSANVHFQKIKEISPERRTEIIEAHKDKPLFGIIVKALITADEYQSKIKMGSFKFGSIDLHLGISPSVSIKLEPKN